MAERYVRVNPRKQSIENIQVLGLRDVEQFLKKELPDAIQRRSVTISALKDSAESMVEGARSNAHKLKRSGALAMTIGVKAQTRGRTLRGSGEFKDTYAAIFVAPLTNMAAYQRYVSYYNRGTAEDWLGDHRLRHAHLVEFGFRHTSGKHIPPRPFLRPAFDTYSSDFIRNFKYILRYKTKRAARANRRKQAARLGMR